MLPANVYGRDNIGVDYVVTAPVAGIPLIIPNKEHAAVTGDYLDAETPKEVTYDNFPTLRGYLD
jgi:hypothetical protein